MASDDLADLDLLDLLPAADVGSLAFLDVAASRKRRRVNRLAVDLVALRGQAAELGSCVAALRAQRGCPKEASPYGRLALQQKALKDKALTEQAELRALLAEQHAFRAFLEKALLKRPRSMILKVEDSKWRRYALGATAEARKSAIHAIADRQYELVESEMLAKGLFEPSEDVFNVLSTLSDCAMTSEAMRYTTLPVPIKRAATAAIELMRERHAMASSAQDDDTYAPHGHTSHEMQCIDDHTTYVRSVYAPPGGLVVTSSMITKTFEQRGVVTVVWRSVLEDEGVPQIPASFVNDEHGWIQLSQDNADATRYTAYVRVSNPIPPQRAGVDKLNDLLQLLYVGTKTDLPRQADMTATVQASFRAMMAQFEALVVQRASIWTESPRDV
ncbi:hypothetical protein SPRG_05404 [Saprolegnia parasitica CBS 223.65]|uniref:Uncharacterized protein n=1 Tax=Saprolegnia parasitica (strain CBS 223.65) TaxID=695850 RepID=A0A067CJ07_SAPPC|nr:hypothetical protein SPRG_05404 [Saprolegnia parasitica CBS 223.65]KDO29160.1 hypothetical protein SPRG_05404 [Saprolegnia parasitica CBS 223.65]|eukprot:XP_012200039.1 hypothetical protein SPRG_05404 [Saprolegnia parasitica CBS 223.65]